MTSLSGRFPRDKDAQAEKDALLFTAVEMRDVKRAAEAIRLGADPNAEDGRPLRRAAALDDYLMARALMLAGADMGFAMLRNRQEDRTIPRKTESGMMLTWSTPTSEEGRRREKELGEEHGRLESFQKIFANTTLPMEQMRLLQEVNLRLVKLEKAVQALTEPQQLQKPRCLGPPPRNGKGNP